MRTEDLGWQILKWIGIAIVVWLAVRLVLAAWTGTVPTLW